MKSAATFRMPCRTRLSLEPLKSAAKHRAQGSGARVVAVMYWTLYLARLYRDRLIRSPDVPL